MAKAFYLFLLFIFPSFLFAQETTTLRISVSLFKQQWRSNPTVATPVDFAKITLINRLTPDTIIVRTDEQGFYRFDSIPSGYYYIKAEREGCQPSSYYPIKVADDIPVYLGLVHVIDRGSLRHIEQPGTLVVNVFEYKQWMMSPAPDTRIENAKVTVTNRETSEVFILYTTSQNSVVIENLPPGNYLVSAEKGGYQSSSTYPVYAGKDSPVSIYLVKSVVNVK